MTDPALLSSEFNVIDPSGQAGWRARVKVAAGTAREFTLVLVGWLFYAALVSGLIWLVVPGRSLRPALIVATMVVGFSVAVWRYREVWRFRCQVMAGSHLMRATGRFRGDGFLLRQSTPADADKIAATMDEVVLQANGLPDRAIGQFERAGRRPSLIGALNKMTITGDDEQESVLGFGSIIASARFEPYWEAGLWLGPQGRGRGLASKVIRAMAAVCRHHGQDRLIVGTSADNTAMRRSLEKAGAELIDSSSHVLPNGETVDSVWYRQWTTNRPKAEPSPEAVAGPSDL